MKKALYILLVFVSPLSMFGQNLEVVGKLKVKTVEDDISSDSLLVLQQDGNIGKRHASSLPNSAAGWTADGDTSSTLKSIGIGTNSPLTKMNIVGVAGSPILSGNSSNAMVRIEGPSVFGYLEIGKKGGGSNDAWLQSGYNSNADAISLNPLGGNVGIGILGPSEKLHVNGNLKVAGIISGVSDPVSDQDAATKGYVDAAGTYSVGDFAQGGIVFWLDETGQHGLVCAKNDQSDNIRWNAGINGNTRARGDGLYSGAANSVIIISSQVAIGDDGDPYAAQICNELQITEDGTTYGDWYLHSAYELILMQANKVTIDSTALSNDGAILQTNNYWSSTEYSSNVAVTVQFSLGVPVTIWNKNNSFDIRAVRSF